MLLSIEAYTRRTGGHRKIADLLAMPDPETSGSADAAFDPPRVEIGIRPADFT